MDNYEVGQILYMTSQKSFKIIPIQVVEEVIRTTINGKEKTYMVCFPDQEKTVVDIKKINSKIFKNVKDVEKHLLDNTRKAIKELIKEANQAIDAVFSVKTNIEETPETALDPVVQQDSQDVILKVDLGNGQYGRLKKEQIDNLGGN